jgi:hypothetical protein
VRVNLGVNVIDTGEKKIDGFRALVVHSFGFFHLPRQRGYNLQGLLSTSSARGSRRDADLLSRSTSAFQLSGARCISSAEIDICAIVVVVCMEKPEIRFSSQEASGV